MQHISEIGLPRFCTSCLEWQFPLLQRRVAALTQTEEFWSIFTERYAARDLYSRSALCALGRKVYDCVYILEEAARRHFHCHAQFPDLRQKIVSE